MKLLYIFILVAILGCASLTQKENKEEPKKHSFKRCWKCEHIIPSGSERFHDKTYHKVMPNRYFD